MRHTEGEPAQQVLDRLRNNPPIEPKEDPMLPRDVDYPRRKEAWEVAVRREEARLEAEREEGGKRKAPVPFQPTFFHGAKAGGPEVASAEEQEKTRQLRLQADAQTRELEKLAKRKPAKKKKR